MMIPTDEYSSADGDSSPKYGMIGFIRKYPTELGILWVKLPNDMG